MVKTAEQKPDKDLYGVARGKIVKHFICNGFECIIRSMGTHPCCYVFLEDGDPFANATSYDDVDINMHGGCTFVTSAKDFREILNIGTLVPSKTVIGWDYAHCGDRTFSPYSTPICGDRYWTKKELVDEIKNVTESLLLIKKWWKTYE